MNFSRHEVRASQTNGAALEVRNMIPSLFGHDLSLSVRVKPGVLTC